MPSRIILDSRQTQLTLNRLAQQLIENHRDFSQSVLLGVQPRGTQLADKIHRIIRSLHPHLIVPIGKLDITFYRDDFRQKGNSMAAADTDIAVSLEGKRIILVDDVLYTGRTIRAALDAMMDFGRPDDVELLVLIDRRLHRELPIQAKYAGKVVDSIESEKVKVEWNQQGDVEKVWIVQETENKKT
jgi:pyrimidine operon attenuation protein/uracil phosphoribosyltransferase